MLVFRSVISNSLHLTLVSLALGVPAAAAASDIQASTFQDREIIITDCDGLTRAQATVKRADQQHLLHVTLEEGTTVPELLELTGTHRSVSAVHNLTADFNDVVAGSYQICPGDRAVRISRIELEPAGNSSTVAAGGVIAGIAAAGGTVLAFNSSGDGSDGSQPAGNNLSGTSVKAPASTGPAVTPARPNVPGAPDDRDCLNGARVNPISPFD